MKPKDSALDAVIRGEQAPTLGDLLAIYPKDEQRKRVCVNLDFIATENYQTEQLYKDFPDIDWVEKLNLELAEFEPFFIFLLHCHRAGIINIAYHHDLNLAFAILARAQGERWEGVLQHIGDELQAAEGRLHGSSHTYHTHKCRGPLCSNAHTIYMRSRRKREAEESGKAVKQRATDPQQELYRHAMIVVSFWHGVYMRGEIPEVKRTPVHGYQPWYKADIPESEEELSNTIRETFGNEKPKGLAATRDEYRVDYPYKQFSW